MFFFFEESQCASEYCNRIDESHRNIGTFDLAGL